MAAKETRVSRTMEKTNQNNTDIAFETFRTATMNGKIDENTAMVSKETTSKLLLNHYLIYGL